MIGKTLGQYKVLRTFGGEGDEARYVAEDAARGRNVTLRVLPSIVDTKESPESRDEFLERIRAVAALSHPNVAAIGDFGEDEGVAYIATELLEGQTLRQRLHERRLSPVEAVEYARQIADGLAAAHGRDIVHGDLRPENVFITRSGKIKVLDFGLGTTGEPRPMQLWYWSPERVEGRPVDRRSDVFSFGAVLYEMLSGSPAFSGDSAASTMAAVLDEDPPELSRSAAIPSTLEQIVRKCLKKSSDDRYASAKDVANAIDALSEERTTERPPVVDGE
ncbi:MAG: serine/threonine-protein kinase, partial [Vicinamibacteria bacterium]